MSTDDITYITDACQVTCVVAAGRGDTVLKAARDLGVASGIVFQARGTGIRERLGLIGVAVEAEKEIVLMLVANERRDLLIESLFKAAELTTPGAGFIFATPVEKAAAYVPETIIAQLAAAEAKE